MFEQEKTKSGTRILEIFLKYLIGYFEKVERISLLEIILEYLDLVILGGEFR